jgi:hypothetical protein
MAGNAAALADAFEALAVGFQGRIPATIGPAHGKTDYLNTPSVV